MMPATGTPSQQYVYRMVSPDATVGAPSTTRSYDHQEQQRNCHRECVGALYFSECIDPQVEHSAHIADPEALRNADQIIAAIGQATQRDEEENLLLHGVQRMKSSEQPPPKVPPQRAWESLQQARSTYYSCAAGSAVNACESSCDAAVCREEPELAARLDISAGFSPGGLFDQPSSPHRQVGDEGLAELERRKSVSAALPLQLGGASPLDTLDARSRLPTGVGLWRPLPQGQGFALRL